MFMIRFRPIGKIRRTIGGKQMTLFIPKYEYDGVKYEDGTIFGKSPVWRHPIPLRENDIIISESWKPGTKKK